MKYDKALSGWPTASGTIKSHCIVLLLHYSRAVKVRKYYERNQNKGITFSRPFCIIEFQRTSQSKEYFSLRLQYGSMADYEGGTRLEEGVQIPMKVFIDTYSSYKIYDAQPPLPYLLEIIWTHIVSLKASEDPKFSSLRQDQKIEIEFEVAEITNLLQKQFSFSQLVPTGFDVDKVYKDQPSYPKNCWILDACKKLVASGDATWGDESQNKIIFYFRRRNDIFNYFMGLCSSDKEDDQLQLFSEIPAEPSIN